MIIIEVAGHLGQDPETRYTPDGRKVTTFRVATNIRRGQKEKTIWWRVTCWGDRFDKKLQYLKKGSPVIVHGEMGIPEIYQDKDGNNQISFDLTAEMIGFSPFGARGERSQEGSQGSDEKETDMPASMSGSRMQKGAGAAAKPASTFADDEIPF